MAHNSTSRFSKTVENYIKFRPSYPNTLVEFFIKKLGGTSKSVIADVGSGTGLLTELFLKNKNPVFGIEPNQPMREAGEKILKDYSNFTSIDGTAETTTLSDNAVDFILAGQAFHWFDVDKTRIEFQRILKPNGKVLLIWNTRDDAKSDFMKSYNEFLLEYSTDYQLIMHRRLDENAFQKFFGHSTFQKSTFENFQIFDLEGLRGRYLSCSYAYDPTHKDYVKAMLEIDRIFEKHQQEGKIKMWYQTEVFSGLVN